MDGMDDLYKFLAMVSAGMIIADVVCHAENSVDLMRQVSYAVDGRCHICGYKYEHPIIKHLGKRGVECGWR